MPEQLVSVRVDEVIHLGNVRLEGDQLLLSDYRVCVLAVSLDQGPVQDWRFARRLLNVVNLGIVHFTPYVEVFLRFKICLFITPLDKVS